MFIEDKEEALQILSEGTHDLHMTNISARLRGDEEVVLAILSKHGEQLKYASLQLQKKEKVIQTALKANPVGAINCIADHDRTKKMLIYVYENRPPRPASEPRDPILHQYGPRWMLDDKDIKTAILKYNGTSLQYLSELSKDTIDIVDMAIETDAIALEYASARLRDDDILVHKAINKDYRCYRYASPRLRRNINTYKYLSKHHPNDVRMELPIDMTNGRDMELLLQIYDMNPEFCLAISSKMVWTDDHFVYHVLSHNPSLWKKHRIKKIFAADDEDEPYYADHCIKNFFEDYRQMYLMGVKNSRKH